jgi:hypothetical protein
MNKKLITMLLAAVFALGVTGVTYAADEPAKDDKAATTDTAKKDDVKKKKKVEGC